MKEKRYLCDYIDAMSIIQTIFFGIVCVLIAVIGGNISYNVILSKYDNELNAYSESTYKYLEEVADNVVQEGIGIDLRKLPEDIAWYNITSPDNDGIIQFTYYLNNNQDMLFAKQSSMTVELSKDSFKIISKIPDCFSKVDYVLKIKEQMSALSAVIGLILVMVLIIAIMIVDSFSRINKKRFLARQS